MAAKSKITSAPPIATLDELFGCLKTKKKFTSIRKEKQAAHAAMARDGAR
jgi:hypothetical protein